MILTIRNIDHDCVTNSKKKKELLDFWVLSGFYLLYQVVIIEQELSICVHVPAEIHLLLRKQKWEFGLSHVQFFKPTCIPSYLGKATFPTNCKDFCARSDQPTSGWLGSCPAPSRQSPAMQAPSVGRHGAENQRFLQLIHKANSI